MIQMPFTTNPRVVVIDLDTGTVVGTNVVVAYVPEHMEEEITSNDNAAVYHGSTYGIPLFVEESLDG